MKTMNYQKYRPYPAVNLPDRTWPGRTITKAPVWCSVDLRDGNQALSTPMNIDEKIALFDLIVAMGFKEIEVGFPSAAAVEFQFVRKLIEEKRIPDDVTIQVLVQAREHLIRKTFEALAGVPKAIIHMYNSTSTAQREVVFGKSKAEIMDIAVAGTRLVKELAAGDPDIRFEYSPESFTGTEPDYALEVCHAVMDAWGPSVERKIIFNLPSTIEMSTPNVYADLIEGFSRSVRNRDAVIISVHTHNDRGTAVAAAELAVLAGADRVEGALFGNGERSGNMDMVTMALNLFSRGIDPGLDITDLDRIQEVYTRCTRMDVHPRHPYAGALVYTAFSGSHQDAISKGMKDYARSPGEWKVPYLPIDPKDVGRTYEAIIRINSQSGKGGVAYILEREFGIIVPKWMQADTGAVVQAATDAAGRELSPSDIFRVFDEAYLKKLHPYTLKKCHIDADDDESRAANENLTRLSAVIGHNGAEYAFEESGNGPVDALVRGLVRSSSLSFSLVEYAEHAVGEGSDARAIAYVKVRRPDGKEACGAGTDPSISTASVKAVLSALNRLER